MDILMTGPEAQREAQSRAPNSLKPSLGVMFDGGLGFGLLGLSLKHLSAACFQLLLTSLNPGPFRL